MKKDKKTPTPKPTPIKKAVLIEWYESNDDTNFTVSTSNVGNNLELLGVLRFAEKQTTLKMMS